MKFAYIPAALLMAALFSSCAWSNRANRPVWDAFEKSLVPENNAAFYVTLPLTVPTGVGAILVDTFVAHPIQVADNAYDDAGDLWQDLDWRDEYYTELSALVFRIAGTPLVFLGSFVGRSMFDFPDAEASAAQIAKEDALALGATLEWLNQVAVGRHQDLEGASNNRTRRFWSRTSAEGRCRERWSPELAEAWGVALTRASALGRAELYETARRFEWPPLQDDPTLALRDQDPVLRWTGLRKWPDERSLPPALLAQLLSDSSESVRNLAAQIQRRKPAK